MENPKVPHKKRDTEEKMAIWDYAAYFHDGQILEIDHEMNNVVVFMESSELDLEDFKEDIKLTKDEYFKGKLHIEGVKSIRINGIRFFRKIEKEAKCNSILRFKVEDLTVFLYVEWQPPAPRNPDFSAFEIEAEKIWWENLPDLEDPFE